MSPARLAAVLVLALAACSADDRRDQHPPTPAGPAAPATPYPGDRQAVEAEPVALEADPVYPAPPEAFAAAATATADAELARRYALKLVSPDWQAWMSTDRIPVATQDFPEEAGIRDALSRLARERPVPTGVRPLGIPDLEPRRPVIDGRIGADEWRGSRTIAIPVAGSATTLRLGSDGRSLFLAVDAPQERTPEGFDQLRFYWHVELDLTIANQRIHVGRGGDAYVIRETRVRWTGAPPSGKHDSWKQHPISDWHVSRYSHGRSEFDGHRSYEAELPLGENGIHPGVAFPAFVEVETDPVADAAGRFQRRRHLGELGSQQRPIWLVIEAPARLPDVERY